MTGCTVFDLNGNYAYVVNGLIKYTDTISHILKDTLLLFNSRRMLVDEIITTYSQSVSRIYGRVSVILFRKETSLMFEMSHILKIICLSALSAVVCACSGESNNDTGAIASVSTYCDGSTGSSAGISIAWDTPTKYSDNSNLDYSELQSYNIYYGTEPGNYTGFISIDDLTVNSCSVPASLSGTYYIVMTVELKDGRESGYSNELVRII